MKNKFLYIAILAIFSIASFFVGWQMHKSTQTPILTSTPIQTTQKDAGLDEYEKYTANLDATCPFISTAATGACLDSQIIKQKKLYDSLSKELVTIAVKRRTGLKGDGGTPSDISRILSEFSDHTKTKDAYIGQMCDFRNSMELGTGIVEASRKCTMYYNAIDIQTLEGIISDVKNDIFPD
mgnify:CR=1 FL=1